MAHEIDCECFACWMDHKHLSDCDCVFCYQELKYLKYRRMEQKMNRTTFEDSVFELAKKCHELRKTKGRDYSGADDIFFSTKEDAKLLGISEEKVLALFYNKHHRAIMKYLKDGELHSEGIEDRLMDAINFLSLIYVWLEEKKL